jgi:drug/metabolite transporter (DMT)-like permease
LSTFAVPAIRGGKSTRAFWQAVDSLPGRMNNLGLYLASVLIWGSTWLAITFQLGHVPPEVSVAYRFALASAMLFAWCGVRRLRLAYSWREHRWMALQGALLFGLNYVCVYLAEAEISSGLVALIFSLIVFMNIATARIFLGTKPVRATLGAAVLGVSGVTLVLLPEIGRGASQGNAWLGIAFAVVSTISASLGNIVAARNQRDGLPVMQMNAFGMAYGALFVASYAVVKQRPFVFDPSPAYVWSLLYLALFGSVLAFGAYLTLVGRIGAGRAGYVAAMIPIVAVMLSTAFEGLVWHGLTLAGVALCLAGNVLILRRKASANPETAPSSPAMATLPEKP